MVCEERRSGLPLRPAASPRLRAVINWIPDEELLEMSAQAHAKGWEHVKLYFMIIRRRNGTKISRPSRICVIALTGAEKLKMGS